MQELVFRQLRIDSSMYIYRIPNKYNYCIKIEYRSKISALKGSNVPPLPVAFRTLRMLTHEIIQVESDNSRDQTLRMLVHKIRHVESDNS